MELDGPARLAAVARGGGVMNHALIGHTWKPGAVRAMLSQRYGNPLYPSLAGPLGEPSPVTVVLLRCACGAVKTKTIDGHWTLAEVAGVGG